MLIPEEALKRSLILTEGWHPKEENRSGTAWCWSGPEAEARFANPHSRVRLNLRLRTPVDKIDGPQRVAFRIGRSFTFETRSSNPDPHVRTIEIPASELGSDDWVHVEIHVDPVYEPAKVEPGSGDERQLGVQLFDTWLEVD